MEPKASLPFSQDYIFHVSQLGVVAPRSTPTPKLEYHPFLAVRDCIFDIFAATLIRKLRTLHAVVTSYPPNMGYAYTLIQIMLQKYLYKTWHPYISNTDQYLLSATVQLSLHHYNHPPKSYKCRFSSEIKINSVQ
jgi:hypothetical protein